MQRLELILAVVVAAALFLAALLAPFFAVHPPSLQYRQAANLPPVTLRLDGGWHPVLVSGAGSRIEIAFWVRGFPYQWLGLSWDRHLLGSQDAKYPLFLLGTDALGRDLWSRVIYALRFSLAAGLTGALLALAAGLPAGCWAGYRGGWVDAAMMRLCDLMLALPGLFLVLGLRAVFPLRMDSWTVFWLVVTVFVLIGWASVTRVVRGQVAALKEMPHVAAVRMMGASHTRILLRHILPFLRGYLGVQFLVFLPLFMLGEITMSFLGVGVQEPEVSLGTMLGGASSLATISLYPWQLAVPAAAVLLPALALNLLGEHFKKADADLPSRWW
jgi:peptide/nickel transport system permease protein